MNLICKAVKDQTDQNVHSWEEKDWHFYFETDRILTMKKMCLREVFSEWLEQEPTRNLATQSPLAPATSQNGNNEDGDTSQDDGQS